MFRDSTAAGSPFVDLVITPLHGVLFQWRGDVDGSCSYTSVAGIATPQWLKLTRARFNFSAFYSGDGVTWKQVGSSVNVSLQPSAIAGLAVTSINLGALNTSTFSNVNFVHEDANEPTIAAPAAANPNPTTSMTTSGPGIRAKERHHQ